MSQTTPTSCPICTAPSPSMTGRTHMDGTNLYTQYGCGACTIEFWWPLKNPGAQWYSSADGYSERNSDPVWNATANHKKTLSLLAAHRGKVLDIGCGIGNFLSRAKDLGWQCVGIDFDPHAIEAARKKTGISDLEVADVVEYAQQHGGEKFDLITFFDVLEHVDNHNEFIATIKSLLLPRGHIAMSMPYRKHALWLMKADLPPRHLTCWDRRTLRRFLEARGFEIVYIRRNPAALWTIIMKLRFKYGSKVSFGAVNTVRKSIGDTTARPGRRPWPVRIVHSLAKAKDAILFGIPAICIWIAMIPSPRRYDDLYAIARMRA